MKLFLSNTCLRHSCYKCHSKQLTRNSDITLADFWGINNVLPELNDNNGTSLLLVHSKKGQKLLDAVKDDIVIKEAELNNSVASNPSAYKSVLKPSKRKSFYKDLANKPFNAMTKKYAKTPFIKKLIISAKYRLSKLLH